MEHLTRFERAVSEITAIGESRQRCITITRRPGDDFDVRIDPRWYSGVTAETFKAEFSSAVGELQADFSQQRGQLFRKYFRTHLFESTDSGEGRR